jgi:hypothetical protein
MSACLGLKSPIVELSDRLVGEQTIPLHQDQVRRFTDPYPLAVGRVSEVEKRRLREIDRDIDVPVTMHCSTGTRMSAGS